MSEQLQFDPGLDGLSGPQLLDVAQLVVVLNPPKMPTERKGLLKTDNSSSHIKIRVPKNETTEFNLSDFVHILYLLKKTL